MPASPEMPTIIKTGVIATMSALAITGTAEHSATPVQAETISSPAAELITQELGHTAVKPVLPPPSIIRSEAQPSGPQDQHLRHLRRPLKVPRILRAIRGCESGGGVFTKPNYTIVNSSGHGGAYQFDAATWGKYHGIVRPEKAAPTLQDRRAIQVLHKRGTSPWNASIGCWGKAVAPVAPRY